MGDEVTKQCKECGEVKYLLFFPANGARTCRACDAHKKRIKRAEEKKKPNPIKHWTVRDAWKRMSEIERKAWGAWK